MRSSPADLSPFIVRDPLIVLPDAAAMDAIALMHNVQQSALDRHQQIRASCVLVVENGRYVGVLTERDIVRLIAQQLSLAHTAVSQVMTPATLSLRESALVDVSSAIGLLQQNWGQQLPILNEQDYPIGLVTHETLQPALDKELCERRRIEALLFESERRYASLSEVAPVGIFRTDEFGNCTYVNERYCRITGATLDSALRDGWQRFIHPHDCDMVVNAWERSVQERREFRLEYRLQRPDSSIVWVQGQAIAERDSRGCVVGYAGALIDISDCKRAEAALKQSELTNSTIMDTMPDLLIHMDKQGNYSRIAGGSAVHVKHPSQASSERDVYTVLPSELARQRLDYANRALESGSLQVYEQLFDCDGDLCHEEVRIAPLNEQEVLIIVRDITERKRAEAQLQNLFEGTAAATGKDFFPALARHIAQALNVSHAGVTEWTDDRLHVLAFWADGRLQPCSSFDATNLPCGRTLQDGSFCFEGLIKQAFVEATDKPWGDLKTYVGVALRDSSEKSIGTLFVMHEQALQAPQQAGKILQIFAARAAAELERQRATLLLENLNHQLEVKVKERMAALQESEQRFRSAVANAPFPIMIHAEDGEVLQTSAAWTELTGYTHSDIPTTDAWAKLAYGDRASEILETTIRPTYLLDSRCDEGEFTITTRDGGQRIWHFNSAPLGPLPDGRRVVTSMAADVTQRRQAEAALRESEERYRSIYTQASIGLANTSVEGRLLDVNPRFCQMLGYSREELISKTVAEITHPDDRGKIKPDIQRLLTGEIPYFYQEKRYLCRNGGFFWAATGVSIVRNAAGQTKHTLAVIRDINDRKQAEAQVHALLKRTQLLNRISAEIRNSFSLSTIIQNLVEVLVAELPADICTFAWYQHDAELPSDPGHWIVESEQKAAGLSSSLGTYAFDQFPQLLNRIVNNQVYRVDSAAEPCSQQLAAYLNQIGISTFLCIPIHTGSGKIGSLQIGRIADEQAWQNKEIELLQSVANQVAIAISQAQLYEESQAKTQQLEQSYRELQEAQLHMVQAEKMSSLGQLVAGIAHEINNPVGFIYGNLAAASDYSSSLATLVRAYQHHYPNPPEAIAQLENQTDIDYILSDFPKLLASMENGATRIQNIVQSLRMFSRLEQADYSAVDIHSHIDNTLVILQNRLNGRAGNPRIQVVQKYGDLPPIECYSSLLDQVFMNLLANAIDAVEERQADATPGYEGQITITTSVVSSEKVAISVRDNGIGMTSSTRARIFNPFFTTKPIGVGTGMGLSISYQIVTGNHQGQLYCQSTLGEGTEFGVELLRNLGQVLETGG